MILNILCFCWFGSDQVVVYCQLLSALIFSVNAINKETDSVAVLFPDSRPMPASERNPMIERVHFNNLKRYDGFTTMSVEYTRTSIQHTCNDTGMLNFTLNNNGSFSSAYCVNTSCDTVNCRFLLQVQPTYTIKLIFHCISLSYGDVLHIFDDGDSEDHSIASFKRNYSTPVTLYSSGDVVSVQFSNLVSDELVGSWTASFEATTNICYNISFSGTNGRLRSPNFPYGSYPRNNTCRWFIFGASEHHIIQLLFHKNSSINLVDCLEIQDYNKYGQTIARFAGTSFYDINTTTNAIIVVFISQSEPNLGWSLTWQSIKLDEQPQPSSTNVTVQILLGIFATLTLTFLTVFGFYWYRRYTLLRTRRLAEIALELRSKNCGNHSYSDPWEISRNSLEIFEHEPLGTGAFGLVFKGKLFGKPPQKSLSNVNTSRSKLSITTVAVKMVPEYSNAQIRTWFREEIDTMKELGLHPRIVKIIGSITVVEPICLVLEYCSDGDLLTYLHKKRSHQRTKTETQPIEFGQTSADTLSKSTEMEERSVIKQKELTTYKELLSLAWQISDGLQFICSKGFVHRDVAARNVLVHDKRYIKVGDFGLAQRVNYSGLYYSRKEKRLPFKWMALESIKDHQFSPKSDVWSFGVLLFELVTLGSVPYSSIQPFALQDHLACGHRIQQPAECPNDLYKIMLSCWKEQPCDRPDFDKLKQILGKLLENEVDEQYIILHEEATELEHISELAQRVNKI